MHIVLTGGTGFIGTHLLQKLIDAGHTLCLITRPNSNLTHLQSAIDTNMIGIFPFDGSYESILPAFTDKHVDAVVHLAAFSQFETEPHDMASMINANVTFGSLLLEAMKHHQCDMLINTGTFSQHKTSAEYEPCCFYASTKAAFECVIDYYSQSHQLRALTLKLTDSYGPNDTRQKLFNFLHTSYQKGQPLDMTPGEQTIYLTHIDDITNAYIIALDHLNTQPSGKHEHYFVAGTPHPLKNVVETYQKITGRHIHVIWGGIDYRPSQIMKPFIGQLLPKWSPHITLEEGIKTLSEV